MSHINPVGVDSYPRALLMRTPDVAREHKVSEDRSLRLREQRFVFMAATYGYSAINESVV